jgi:FkbM family methyltransferase
VSRATNASLTDRFARGALHWKRWVLSKQPALIWGARRVFRAYPEPEIALLQLLCQRDQTMVDIGASFGMWSYFARPYAGRIVAFEPLPPLATALSQGFRAWGERVQRVRIHQVALSSESGTAKITMPQLQWGYSTIDPSNDLCGKVNEAFGFRIFDVDKRTLDSYDLRGVGFIKVDTEGHEVSVLLGARETLARELPALVVETEERHKQGAVEGVSRIAAELGYRRFFLHGRELRDGCTFCLDKHQDVANPRGYVRNLIFLRETHLERLRATKRLPFALPPRA